MRRRLFNLAAAVSLVLCAATAVTWVVSRGSYLIVSRWTVQPQEHSRTTLGLTFVDGHLICAYSRVQPSLPYEVRKVASRGWTWGRFPLRDNERLAIAAAPNFLGFRWESDVRGPVNDRRLVLPAWSLVLLFALPPLIAVGRWRRAMRRTRLNLCPTCGYDLRATPERCPECGTAVAERAAI